MIVGYKVTIIDNNDSGNKCYEKNFMLKDFGGTEDDAEELYNLQKIYKGDNYQFKMVNLIG